MRGLLKTIVFCQVLATFGAPQEVEKIRQQRQKRQEQELQRLQQEKGRPNVIRAANPASAGLTDFVRSALQVRTEGCLSIAMVPDPAVDLQSLPLKDWVDAGDKEQIPWRVDIDKPELRFDQRYELSYSGSIDVKDLEWPGDSEELQYITAISGANGDWIIPPKIGRRIFENKPVSEKSIAFGDCVFLRPGDYTVNIAAYDAKSRKYSLTQRKIRRSDFADEPLLPTLDANLPTVSFPQSDEAFIDTPEIRPPALSLAVSNKRPLDIELISPLNFPDEWSYRTDFIRATTNRLLAGISVLSQIKLVNSSISAAVIDLVNRTTLLEQKKFAELDWKQLADAYPTLADASKLSLSAIETRKDRAAFFREFLKDRLNGSKERTRVLIIVSGSVIFEGGSDTTPVSVEGDCHCRVYHLHFKVANTDSFNDLEKILRRVRPKTFAISSPHDFRKALAEVVHDLETM